MQKAPVNSLSLEMLRSLTDSILEAEGDPECRAIILQSAQPGVFSAGLEITEMMMPDDTRLRNFWWTLQEMFLTLSTSKVATVAAIEGSSPAGGCLIAMSCDWRVMSAGDPVKKKPFVIGLNETQLGIVAPFWFQQLYGDLLGWRKSDDLLQTGALVPAAEAATIGLVDEAVEHSLVVERAAAKVKALLSIPDAARHKTKMLSRGPLASALRTERDADTEQFVQFTNSEAVQTSLHRYMDALKKRAAKN